MTAPSFTIAAGIAKALGVRGSDLAMMQREQSSIDVQLVHALTEAGIDETTAQPIRGRISTPARAALLDVLRPH